MAYIQYDNNGAGTTFSSPNKGAVSAGGAGSSGWDPSMLQNNNPLSGVFAGPGFTGGGSTGMSPAGDVPGNTPMQNPNGTSFDADNYGNPTGPYVNPSAGASGFNNAAGTPNFTPQYQQNLGGYNPQQYATTGTANDLAQMLGGRVQQTRYDQASPFGIPPQNMINFGGADSLNAGLLADRYAKYDRATADAMTRAELAMMGPGQAPNADSQGGSLGSWSQYTAAPGGNDYLGQGANMGQFLGTGARPQGGVGNGGSAPQQYGNQIFNTNQPAPQQGGGPQGFSPASFIQNLMRGGSPRPQAPRMGGFGQYGAFNAANSFRNRPPAFNQGLMGQLMGMPSLLSRLNQVSGFGGQGGPFGMGSRYGSFAGGRQGSFNPNYSAPGFTGFGQPLGIDSSFGEGSFFDGRPRFPSQGALYQQAPGMVTPANPAEGDWWSNHMGI